MTRGTRPRAQPNPKSAALACFQIQPCPDQQGCNPLCHTNISQEHSCIFSTKKAHLLPHSATKQQQEFASTFARAERATERATCKSSAAASSQGKVSAFGERASRLGSSRTVSRDEATKHHMNALWAALQAHTGDSGFQMGLWSCKLLWGSATGTSLVVESRLLKGKQRQPSACRV